MKASPHPWLGHGDIDLTVKTGACELWCHESVLRLPLSPKEDEEKRGWRKEEGDAGRQVRVKQINLSFILIAPKRDYRSERRRKRWIRRVCGSRHQQRKYLEANAKVWSRCPVLLCWAGHVRLILVLSRKALHRRFSLPLSTFLLSWKSIKYNFSVSCSVALKDTVMNTDKMKNFCCSNVTLFRGQMSLYWFSWEKRKKGRDFSHVYIKDTVG